MPKDIFTPRNELICGKIEECTKLIQENKLVDAIDMLVLISHDAIRMEQKLISRKEEVKNLLKLINKT